MGRLSTTECTYLPTYLDGKIQSFCRSVLSHSKQHRQQANYTSFSGMIIVCCQPTVCSSRCASPRA